jgi:hypothetical protein
MVMGETEPVCFPVTDERCTYRKVRLLMDF